LLSIRDLPQWLFQVGFASALDGLLKLPGLIACSVLGRKGRLGGELELLAEMASGANNRRKRVCVADVVQVSGVLSRGRDTYT